MRHHAIDGMTKTKGVRFVNRTHVSFAICRHFITMLLGKTAKTLRNIPKVEQPSLKSYSFISAIREKLIILQNLMPKLPYRHYSSNAAYGSVGIRHSKCSFLRQA